MSGHVTPCGGGPMAAPHGRAQLVPADERPGFVVLPAARWRRRVLAAGSAALVLLGGGCSAPGEGIGAPDANPPAATPSGRDHSTAPIDAIDEPSSGSTGDATPSAGADLVAATDEGPLPVPRSGDEAVGVLANLPRTLRDGEDRRQRLPGDAGTAFYAHPGGQLGVEVIEIADMFGRPVAPDRAVDLISRDLDRGTVRPCGLPPGVADDTGQALCVTGRGSGLHAMVWTRSGSELVLIAVWPDARAGAALVAALRAQAATR